MKDIRFLLKPKYTNSRALLIGIDKYRHSSPLSYAVSDANEIKSVLQTDLGFLPQNIVYLTDQEATRDTIMQSFINFTNDDVELDDRIIVFFAGHGVTRTGYKGEVGYLAPYDANPHDYSTFVRWDDLTRNAELIRAKHMLFIMDACYGGLALVRTLQPGSTRFLKDMLLRYSRQVLTAGKANEVVADSGGPLENHSVFTGHLIEGLRGKAETHDGVLTASALMGYVYQRVANDKDSNQTPHYGYFDGDGDFILRMPTATSVNGSEVHDIDELIIIPYSDELESSNSSAQKIQTAKELLANENSLIRLHDFAIEELRRFLSQTEEDRSSLDQQFSTDALLERISRYEKSVWDLCAILASISYWAKAEHKPILKKVFSRSTDRVEIESGLLIWVALRWYPLILQLYCSGIAAVEGGRYDCLKQIFYTKVPSSKLYQSERYFAQIISGGIVEIGRSEAFKQLPGHERHYMPLNEYLFKILQPLLEDILFLGKSYEHAFDEFEVLFALTVADISHQNQATAWGPIGRFGWKEQNYQDPPFSRIIAEAKIQKTQWPPLVAGLFGGDYQRFIDVVEEYKKILASRRYW